MKNSSLGVLLAVATCSAVHADPLKHSLLDGVFKPGADSLGEGAVHPLPPSQKLQALESRTFRVLGCDDADRARTMAFPVVARAEGGELADLKALEGEEPAFIAPVDLTGTGASDLLYATRSMSGWGVLSNGARLPKPVQGFVAGYYPKDAAAPRTDLIPADNRDLAIDQDLLAASGDFLGNGTEQLAYTRPGYTTLFIVGAHGVTTMKADLSRVQSTPAGERSHWLFPYRSNRKGQRTRLAYYRLGADHMIRLVPKGMEFVSERVPLKGHWERLNQNALDWPAPAHPAQPAPPQAPLAQDEKSSQAK
jgi:hypothetical protein